VLVSCDHLRRADHRIGADLTGVIEDLHLCWRTGALLSYVAHADFMLMLGNLIRQGRTLRVGKSHDVHQQ
jgi:hypothetical protein